MAAALARGKRGANNRACARNYLISNGLIFDGVKVGFNSFAVISSASRTQAIDFA
jgi:hypothetical protein